MSRHDSARHPPPRVTPTWIGADYARVQGFLVDPGDRRATHVLLREGHVWGRKEVAIPVSAVTGYDGGIRLNITKKQVAELPPVD